MSPLLELFLAVVLVAGFGLSTALIAIALGAQQAVPLWVLWFLRSVAAGQEPVQHGQRGRAIVFFGVLAIGTVAVPTTDLGDQLRRGDVFGAISSCGQLAVEMVWVVYLWFRERSRGDSTGAL
jgi:hypothetical protein